MQNENVIMARLCTSMRGRNLHSVKVYNSLHLGNTRIVLVNGWVTIYNIKRPDFSFSHPFVSTKKVFETIAQVETIVMMCRIQKALKEWSQSVRFSSKRIFRKRNSN